MMNDTKLKKCLYGALVIITATMFLVTVNYVNTSNNTQVPTAITAFNA